MRILKFILLSSALCLNLLAFDFSTIDDWTYTTSVKNSFLPVDVSASPVDAVVLDDQFLQIGDDVYSYTGFSPVVFNVELLKNNGFFLENKSKEAPKNYSITAALSKALLFVKWTALNILVAQKMITIANWALIQTLKALIFLIIFILLFPFSVLANQMKLLTPIQNNVIAIAQKTVV